MTKHENLPLYTGRPRRIEDAEQLRLEFMAFLEDRIENPLKKPTLVNGKDGVQQVDLDLPRPLTLTGFRLWLDINESTWHDWRKNREDLKDTIAKIEDAIYDQKFEGATVGLFNANIIARELGLADRQTIDITPAELPDPVDATRIADCIHPDDPDPTGPNRPLFTRAQIAAGIPFWEPE